MREGYDLSCEASTTEKPAYEEATQVILAPIVRGCLGGPGRLEEVRLTRYRLRFHLQEVDLQRGTTYIGRSEECEVTIEDPLVSRRHARIVFGGEDVTIEDLGSRNGVKVNGRAIQAPHKLVDGDRVRIGTQDFVLCLVKPKPERQSKTTGVLRLCGSCKAPYAREMISCPNCGATEQTDEETLSGAFGPASQYSWSVQLLMEALQKSVGMGRLADADRILRRATALLEERLASGGAVQPEQLGALAEAAEKICVESRDTSWGSWFASFCVRADLFPPAALAVRLASLRAAYPELHDAVDALIGHFRAAEAAQPRGDRDAFQLLVKAHRGGHPGEEETSSAHPKLN